MFARFFIVVLAGALVVRTAHAADVKPANDYAAVDAIFFKHCLDCHAAQDPEAKLVLESFETLMKGGEAGAVLVSGKSADSLLVKMIEGRVEREGKKKIMPPGKRKKLDPEEIAAIKAWIDAGAHAPPEGKTIARILVVPKITPKVKPRMSINALAYAPESKLIAVARYGEVELRSADSHSVVRTLAGHRGNVNAVVFSADGSQLFAAAGEPGLFGEVRQWKVADGTPVRTLEGHKDALYSIALSPDGKILATGSYDQKIKLWKVETGEEIKTLAGHNGCVFDLAFRPDGKILASASADRTVKLWDVATGERRDTLSQSLKELYAVAFSPDGKRLVAGGVDNRIRVWQITETAAETSNPILDSKFAHEGAILNLIFSPDGKTLLSSADDRTIKLWDATEIKELLVLEKQPDWSPALAFAADKKMIVAGRLDGTLGFYDAATGKPVPPPKPALTQFEPRGIQRGVTARLKLIGTNLTGLTEVKFQNPKLTAEILNDSPASANEVWLQVTAKTNLARGGYEFSVANAGGESGRLKLYVDDLPQAYESTVSKTTRPALKLPASFWGTLDPMGDMDEIEFEAKGGQMVVFDLAARSIGSKANAAMTLLDAKGAVLDVNNGFDGGDPLLAFKIPATGRYRVRVGDEMAGGSKEHFYRLSFGAFPMVVGCFPLSVPANVESEVELIGYNLPPQAKVRIKPGSASEKQTAEVPVKSSPSRSTRNPKTAQMQAIPIMEGGVDVPIDPEKFRTRRAFKVLVGDGPELVEVEPNDTPGHAMKIPVPCSVNGRIWTSTKVQATDVDLFRFETKAGKTWSIETVAARRGSPIDTRIEVLHPDGKPVERLLLQAVRDSHITFRPIDSITTDCRVENWREMELNQLMYLQGEVCKIFRMPQGPDSGFQFYNANGKRRNYFDTSATVHANDEPCYIVEPHPPGTKLAANGLPVFMLYYANDDDGDRKFGSDSKLLFIAPAGGAYLIRVTDTRGFGGERFAYRLTVHEAKPDFKVTLNGANPTVGTGSGQEFSVSADRIDGFGGEIKVDISGLPPGLSVSTPLVIQAGHDEAKGTLNAAPDAPQPDETNASLTKVTATAMINGRLVTKEVNNLGKIKLGDKPKLFVALEPAASTAGTATSTNATKPLEITIATGQTVPAWLKVRRNGHDDLITFTVDNLPHGVIVDNIGLNGVLIAKDQNEREIFLTAAKWVPETDRLCYAVENQAGKQTSLPVLLHVRKPGSQTTAAVR
jgi:mono/diheme cytochrome c family protein